MMKSMEEVVFPRVPHYYGDLARQLMLLGVALMLVGEPFYADDPAGQFPAIIGGGLLIAAFAALTSPLRRSIVFLDVLLSAAAVVFFGGWAFQGYDTIDSVMFVLRDAIALVFLFAFYFSLKTLRAFLLHQVGKPDSLAEFRRTQETRSAEELIAEETASGSDPLARERETVERYYREERGD